MVDTTGIFLGGAARGQQAFQEQELGRNRLGESKRQFDTNRQDAILEQSRERYSKVISDMKNIIKNSINPKTKDAIIQNAGQQLAPFLRNLQLQGDTTVNDQTIQDVISALQNTPTKGEVTQFGIDTAAKQTTAVGEARRAVDIGDIKAGTQADPRAVRSAASNFVNFTDPKTKQSITLDVNSPEGRAQAAAIADRGFVRTSLAATGSQDDIFGVTEDNVGDFRDQEIAVREVMGTVGRMRDQLKDADTKTGLAAGAIMGLDSLAGSARQLSESFGGTEDEDILNPDKYDFGGMFDEDSAKSAAFKTNSLNLAYAVARAREPNARLSEGDVKRALTSLAASSGSKGQIGATLGEVENDMRRNLKIRHDVTFRGTANKPVFPEDLLPSANGGELSIPKELESFKGNEGDIINDGKNEYIYKDGSWQML